MHSDVGGLYEDNHRVADEALRWIAEPACRAGLRLKPGASLTIPPAPVVLHNSHRLASNLWGALGSVKRDLKGLREAVFK